MFTGLIETVGTIRSLGNRGNYRILTIESSLGRDQLKIGESVACNGVCLTVVAATKSGFEAEASQETISTTTIGKLGIGNRLNLERALSVGDRLGGHFVTGHVDTTATVSVLRRIGESVRLEVQYDSEYDQLMVRKGSIAIDGVSLTVNEVHSGSCSVNLIPHTLESSNLKNLKKGDEVNLEFDLIGKYISRMLANSDSAGLTIDKLKESGW